MNHAAITTALTTLGFYLVEAGSFQRTDGNVIIGVDLFDAHMDITYIVGCRMNGTWEATSLPGLLAELKAANANFFGYPGYVGMAA